MKYMSHCISKLEEYPDLEASAIRSTKINRVIKSIAKLEHIPRENKFNFKDRCTELLAKYTKTLQKDLKLLYINDPDFVPSTQTFNLFGGLPPELKTMVWKYAAKDYAAALDWTDCRTHATKFGLDLLSWSRDGEMPSKLAIPPLFHITRLSREIIWDAIHGRCFWAACEREVKTSFGPWATYPVEEWETEEKTLEAEEFEEEGVDKQIGGGFFLYFEEKRDTMKTGKCAIIPDFRVGDNVLTRVVGEGGNKKIVVATKGEREAGKEGALAV